MNGSCVNGTASVDLPQRSRCSTRVLTSATVFAIVLTLATSLAGTAQAGQVAVSSEQHTDDETLLVEALNHVRGQRLDAALGSIESLVERNPKFRLAQLVYGDLLLAKSQPIERFGNVDGAAMRGPVTQLRDEALSRFRHHLSRPSDGKLPSGLLQLSPRERRVIVVDVARSRLYLFENAPAGPKLIADYYVSTGKNGAVKEREGDRKTPVGVYFVTGHIPPEKLPDFYGAGAFPIDYPNAWDRRLGKTGYGIWLHGVPSDTYSRAPRTSDGCVALANADFESVIPFVDVARTPVLIGERVTWVPPRLLAHRAEPLRTAIEAWRRDWESKDMARYSRHYAKSFHSGRKDYRAWVEYKRRVNARKRYIRVAISDLSLFAYPDDPDMVVATFEQDYSSDNYNGVLKKRQYWRREADGVWRIVYEGAG